MGARTKIIPVKLNSFHLSSKCSIFYYNYSNMDSLRNDLKTIRLAERNIEWKDIPSQVVGEMDQAVCNGCDGCGLRCAAGVQVTRSEMNTIRLYTDDLKNRVAVEKVLGQSKEVDLGDDVKVFACRYRDMENGRCAIYPVRPLICRLFGYVEWLPCPIEKVQQKVPLGEALEIMAEISKQPRRTFEEWDQRENCNVETDVLHSVTPATGREGEDR